ncbi:MAG: hypothetical protein V2J26_00265, partial [Pacificimonas sp.]|nr:hypothetical protein [Pacificimonas sp.]
RAARRAAAKKPAHDAKAARRARARTRPALAQLPLDLPGSEEFVVMVARRTPEGTLDLIGTAEHRGALVDQALKAIA